ncbi:hypothetical protein COCVIDRAFT_21266, partial [Bipolaris victoriae FI3]
MAPTFADFIQSPQFTFFVGQEGKPVVVHAAAVAATSPQLDALVSGGMQESETRCARIEDVRVDDFIRFCEYTYRGDYTVPPWEKVLLGPSYVPGKNEQNDDNGVAPVWDEFPAAQEPPSMECYPQEAPACEEPAAQP